MSCEDVLSRLDELVDGELTATEAALVEQHIAGCAGCSEELRRLRRLLDAASRLPTEIAPARDLWPAIASRLPEPSSAGRSFVRPYLAVAAALLVTVATLALVLSTRGRNEGLPTAARGEADVQVSEAAVQAAYRGLDEELARVRQELRTVVNARRDEISPATLEVVNQNLAVIDAAIARIAAALREEPDNPELNRLLLAACRQELSLLSRVARMPAEPRAS